MSEQHRRPPVTGEQFRELKRGQHVQDRRVWTVRAEPYVEDGEYRMVLQAGDLVLIERERFIDGYALADDVT